MTEQIPKRLEEAIISSDVPLTRSILIGLLNKSLTQAQVLFEYAIMRLPSILEVHDEELYPVIRDSKFWSEDYWHGLTGDQMRNFSRERFHHLIEVGCWIDAKRDANDNNCQDVQNSMRPARNIEIESKNPRKTTHKQPNKTWNPKNIKTKERLDSAIHDQEVQMARSIIIGLANDNFGEALRALVYAGDRMPELFQPHNDKLYPMRNDSTEWTEDYWHGLTGDLMRNFSKERFQHLCDVGVHVLPQKYAEKHSFPESATESKIAESKLRSSNQSDNVRGVVCIALAIGVVIVIPWIIWKLFFSR